MTLETGTIHTLPSRALKEDHKFMPSEEERKLLSRNLRSTLRY